MRIIAGSLKGRQILAPSGADTRPTLDRVKEALFGILQLEVPESRVLDLFSGSGNLGFEAISRGAVHAVLCDQSRSVVDLIRANAQKLGVLDRVMIVCSDYRQLLLRSDLEPFDLVLLDPPYGSDMAQKAAVMLLQRNLLREGGLIVIEHDVEHPPMPVEGLMRIRDTRRYGSVRLSFAERE